MSDFAPNTASTHAGSRFETTLWTTVLQAGSTETTLSRTALERLCRTYWYPLYGHARRRGHSPHDSQDFAQGFFAELIEHRPFAGLSPEKGRFRSFLLTAFANYLADENDRRKAVKRGGRHSIVSLDDATAEERFTLDSVGDASPEKDFDRRWALAVMKRALDELAEEQATAGNGETFGRLRPFLTDATSCRDYSAVAIELGMPPNTVAAIVRRLRQRYRELVRAEVAGTLANPADVDAEMRYLLAAMRG